MQKDIATVKKVKKRAKNLRKVANRLTFVAFGRNGLSVMTEKTTLFSVIHLFRYSFRLRKKNSNEALLCFSK